MATTEGLPMRHLRAVLTSLAIAALAGCSHLAAVSPAGVDLSGSWQLDRSRSDAPPPPPRPHDDEESHGSMGGSPEGPPRFHGPAPLMPMVAATRMTIVQDRDSMGIDYPNQQYRDVKWGEQKRSLYVVDAGWDHDRLIIETKSQPMTIRETYSLSPDRDTLTLVIDLTEKRGDRHVTRTFTRVAPDTTQQQN
jgi:hypothetical protein